jgi:hypothetical protein
MIVLVCGQRDFNNRDRLFEILDVYHSVTPITKIVSGGARGADKMAEEWAMFRNVDLRVFRARWDLYGKAAGPIRNRQMYDTMTPDAVIAFYHDPTQSRGTKDMVSYAKKCGCKNVNEHTLPVDTAESK